MSDFYESTKSEFRYISRLDEHYPLKLSEIKDPPAGIYVKGRLPDPYTPSVAIVGSRICSQYGRLCAQQFGEVLARNGIQVISGLARGIDSISQQAAVDAGGRSFGILGCGINVIYPAQNRRVYESVIATGGLISEYPPDTPPIGRNFALRNRIISALADVVLIIEAKEKSGTKITVSRALEQGKDIYAVPGRIGDICSQGCNSLIEQGAGIATGPDTILKYFGIYPKKGADKPDSDNFNTADKNSALETLEAKVYSVLDFYPTDTDFIARKTRLPIPELLNILFHLQMKGFARQEGRGYYSKLK